MLFPLPGYSKAVETLAWLFKLRVLFFQKGANPQSLIEIKVFSFTIPELCEKETMMPNYQPFLYQQLAQVEALSNLSEDVLNWKPVPNAWSVLECLAHLNRYAEYYLPRLQKSVGKYQGQGWKSFRSGKIGGYFVQMIQPGTKAMKTPAKLNPIGSELSTSVITCFLKNQQQYLALVKRLDQANLNRRVIRVEVMPLIHLKIGDAFLFNLHHQERHLLQIQRVLEQRETVIPSKPKLSI